MTPLQYDPSDGLAFAVRLLNSWDELEQSPELLVSPEVAARFLRRHGLDDAADACDEGELRGLRALRKRVRAAWDAPTDEEAVELLNAILGSCRVQPRLARSASGWARRWDRPGLRATAFAPGLVASALLDEIAAHGRRRLGSCAAAPCRCAFVDASRNRVRRYCSTQCGDRAAQAAHRARLRA